MLERLLALRLAEEALEIRERRLLIRERRVLLRVEIAMRVAVALACLAIAAQAAPR
jgi:hypothetical protein